MDSFLEHVNVTVRDPEATARLYGELFGWEVRWSGDAIHGGKSWHVGGEKSYVAVYSKGGGAGAGDSYETVGGLNHLGVVVEDLDACEERVKAAGLEPHSHADYEPGRRFYFDDPDGIEIEVVEYERQGPKVGTFGWHDLTVADAPGLRNFYERVTGWSSQPLSMGDYDDFVMVTPAGEGVAGVCHARGVNADLPPVWLNYVIVADLAASLQAVAEGGGEVLLGPKEMEGQGRYAVIRDPAGAALALFEPA